MKITIEAEDKHEAIHMLHAMDYRSDLEDLWNHVFYLLDEGELTPEVREELDKLQGVMRVQREYYPEYL